MYFVMLVMLRHANHIWIQILESKFENSKSSTVNLPADVNTVTCDINGSGVMYTDSE